jgi:hypothetical protein
LARIENPVHPAQLLAAHFHTFDIDPATMLRSPLKQPVVDLFASMRGNLQDR